MSNNSNSTVTLLAGGDIGPKYEPTDQIAELILPVLQQADLRFGQCERTYTERRWTNNPRGLRSIPLHPRLASVYKTAGIDIIGMAGNHTVDWGVESMLDTRDLFLGMGKHVIGCGKNIAEARTPAIVERNGVNIAFLTYCSVLLDGHEATHDRGGVAPMRARTYYQRGADPGEELQPGTPLRIYTVPYEEDLQALQDDIRKAKQQADVVVMSIHWGVHYIPKTIATYQPPVAHAGIDAGADLVLGHHDHSLKGIEVYKGKVCFYGLGNFLTTGDSKPRKSPEWNNWEFYYYYVDPECRPPEGKYPYPTHCRKTMLAKIVFNKNGVERVSFLPAFINGQAQPAVVPPGDPRFQEILEYMEWLSDRFPHKFRVDGNEVVVDT